MLDKALVEAIMVAVEEESQPLSVARRITAWLERMSEKELSPDENATFLSDVCDALTGDIYDAH